MGKGSYRKVKSMSEAEPLSWMVLPDKHPVFANDGETAGYAIAALGDQANG